MSGSDINPRFSWLFESIVPAELHYEDCDALKAKTLGCTCPALHDETELVAEYKGSLVRRLPLIGSLWTKRWQRRLVRVKQREMLYKKLWRNHE